MRYKRYVCRELESVLLLLLLFAAFAAAAALAFAVLPELYIIRPISSSKSESLSSEVLLSDLFCIGIATAEDEATAPGLYRSTLSIVGMITRYLCLCYCYLLYCNRARIGLDVVNRALSCDFVSYCPWLGHRFFNFNRAIMVRGLSNK